MKLKSIKESAQGWKIAIATEDECVNNFTISQLPAQMVKLLGELQTTLQYIFSRDNNLLLIGLTVKYGDTNSCQFEFSTRMGRHRMTCKSDYIVFEKAENNYSHTENHSAYYYVESLNRLVDEFVSLEEFCVQNIAHFARIEVQQQKIEFPSQQGTEKVWKEKIVNAIDTLEKKGFAEVKVSEDGELVGDTEFPEGTHIQIVSGVTHKEIPDVNNLVKRGKDSE